MAKDYRAEIARALARQRAAADPTKAFERATARSLPASILSVSDVADIVTAAMAEQRADLVGHMKRFFDPNESNKPTEDQRFFKLHARVTHLESEVRRLQRGRPR